MTKHAYFASTARFSLIWVLSAGSARSYELSVLDGSFLRGKRSFSGIECPFG